MLLASVFARYAAGYEFLVDLLVCLGAAVGVQRAVQFKHYVWATGFLVIAIVFSPLVLLTKIFLLMGCTALAACLALWVALRMSPVRAARASAFRTRSLLTKRLSIPLGIRPSSRYC